MKKKNATEVLEHQRRHHLGTVDVFRPMPGPQRVPLQHLLKDVGGTSLFPDNHHFYLFTELNHHVNAITVHTD